jgi:formate dehydrogenase iron-sulfur subunit
MTRAVLFDATLCIGCRGCQVACKEEHRNLAEDTEFFAKPGGYQNPAALSANTFTLVSYHELERAGDNPKWVFVRHQCMHCVDPNCVASCPGSALAKEADGTVSYTQEQCIGCGICQTSCPFGIPVLEQRDTGPSVWKCTFCEDRVSEPDVPAALNEGHRTPDVLDESKRARHLTHRATPACVAACPTGALKHGEREVLLAEAHRRIARHPERYVSQVYGESEAGGTAWLYLAAVPFAELGLRTEFGNGPEPQLHEPAAGVGGTGLLGVAALAGGLAWYTQRRDRVAATDARKGTAWPPPAARKD